MSGERPSLFYRRVFFGPVVMTGVLVLAALSLSFCGSGGKSSVGSPTSPSSPLSISVSPSGLGLDHATNFTFTASGGANLVSYDWDFGDGVTASATTSVVSHVYRRSGVFNVQLRSTDRTGLVMTATLSGVTIRPISGVWDLTLVPTPSYLWLVCTKLTAVLVQNENQIRGTITPTTCSTTRNPCQLGEPLIGYSAPIFIGNVSDSRKAYFGNESFWAVYNSDCVDTYFRVELSSDLNTMSGICAREKCSSVTGVRR